MRRKKSRNSSSRTLLFLVVIALLVYGAYHYYPPFRAAIHGTYAAATKVPATLHTPIGCTATELEIPLTLTPREEQIIRHTGYTVSYNKAWRIPNWVSYELTRAETQGREKRGDRFTADPQVAGTIATNADYTRSGFDKGHMAPAADMKWSESVMTESFYFSNICPQHPELNRRKWKDLEEKIRDWAIADSAVIIITGPVPSQRTRTIGKNRIVVPEQFFKVILSPFGTSPKAIGFLFRNAKSTEPLRTYVVSVDSIEVLTGMDFFAPLPDETENRIEQSTDAASWGL